MTRKICVAITARPSYSRIRSALTAIKARPDTELQLVVTASALLDRYGNAIEVMEREGFSIDRRIYNILEGENLVTSAKSTGFGLAEMATTLADLKPDAVVSIADRFETIANAIAASFLNIPLAHVQGGEVTGSVDEKVRHAITKLADIHLVASERAGERVIKMGERPETVHVTGCPSIDIAKAAIVDPRLPDDLFARYGGVGREFDVSQGYIIVMQHPVTTEYRDASQQIYETLHAVSDIGLPTLWFWPNVDAGADAVSKGNRSFREARSLPTVHFFKNMPPEEFIRLCYNSRGIIGNSSVAIRECAYLGTPAVNIGSRQGGRDRGANVLDVAHDRDAIKAAIAKQWDAGRLASDTLYGDGDSGTRIAEVLATAPLSIDKRLTY